MESYLIKSNLCLLILYIIYRYLIKSDTNHEMNRLIGLGSIVFSATFLLFPTQLFLPKVDPLTIPIVEQSAITLQKAFVDVVPEKSISTFLIIYFIGIGVFTIRAILGLARLAHLFIKSEKINKWGFRVVLSEEKLSPFTFFNVLFINKEDLEKPDLDTIILHEKLHKKQMHSLDMLLLEILTIVNWFNPVAWLFRKSIREEHEYQADAYVLNNGIEKSDYQHMLFNAVTGISFHTVNHLAKKSMLNLRFKMMENRKLTSKYSYLRLVSFVPLMLILAFVISTIPLKSIGQSASSDLSFVVYNDDGEVDLDEGISESTERLFLRVKTKEESDKKYLVSSAILTLVQDGRGVGSVKTGQLISLNPIKQKTLNMKGSILVVEIKEYQVKDENDVVSKVVLEKPYFIEIPVN